MKGYDLRTIQELGRWKDLKMVERYARLSPGHIADAVEDILFTTRFTAAGSNDNSQPLQVVEK
jgi:hypothetical protein